jgi:hypothetical protein
MQNMGINAKLFVLSTSFLVHAESLIESYSHVEGILSSYELLGYAYLLQVLG